MQVHNDERKKVFIGIDWADDNHAYHLIASDGQVVSGALKQDPRAINDWLIDIRQRFPDHELAVCLEQSRGALVVALLKYVELHLFPINPGQLAKYRESMNYGGCKDDPSDAELLAQYLSHYQHRLRRLCPDSPQTRKLAMLSEHRRGLVEQRADLANQLTAVLKQYFPVLIEFKAAKPYARFLLRLLLKWPTLAKLQRVRPQTLRTFFHQLNVRGPRVEARIQMVADTVPLTNDSVFIECSARRAVFIAKQLLLLTEAIDKYDESIKNALQTHEDRDIVAALPGAACLTQARLIAALGTDRARYQNARSLQACSGIAPVTKQSGKSRHVFHRWACPKFMKQTFHEFAGLSIGYSTWARAYYHMQLANGKKPNVAKRALAYKWQRIIYRCWKDRTPYDEAKYLARLRETGSPILKYIAA